MKNPLFIKGIIIALTVVILDQASKYCLVNLLGGEAGRMNILPIFNLVLVRNNGISFGLFHNLSYAQTLFSVMALIIIIFMTIWLYRVKDLGTAIAAGLIIGGAMGNIIDRVRFGSVVDFLDFYIGHYHWPAFNVADSAVCIGALTLAFQGLFDNRNKQNKI